MKTLDGKVVVITGAGSGIGRALALNAADKGALLAVSDWDEAGLDETVELLKGAGAREIRADRLDVSDRQAFAAYAAAVREHFGRVNVVVNNAGVSHSGPVTEMEYADFEWIVGINFWGVVHGTREFLPHLIESGDGHVVNISSLFGLVSMPGQSTYNATKYAVRGFTESVREDMIVAGHPVAVTCVHPGGIKTGIARNGRTTAGEDHAELARKFDTRLARMTPERAAEIILDAVLADKPRVLVGGDAHAIHWLAKLLGARYQDVFARAAKVVLR
ncbi:MAG TPA: SDR family NAD(P)-dependent oxidoreductase [Marmoricola sp.]|nr:SDR family NAD(P)-dependent oxidoreductase [Marmoricola sp.]